MGVVGLIVYLYGKGSVIGMIDNLVFCGYWYGISCLLSNVLFFGNVFYVLVD